ncbi:MAG: hypothetical protein AB1746_05410 [Candidatus Zixiibacteriota bacterium]
MKWHDWLAIFSALISGAGLLASAVSPDFRKIIVIVVFAVLFLISLIVILIRLVYYIKKIESFTNGLQTKSSGLPFDYEKWRIKVENDAEYELDDLEIRVEYKSPDGNSVLLAKRQSIIPRVNNLKEMLDTNIFVDAGEIDVDSYWSSLGTFEHNQPYVRYIGKTKIVFDPPIKYGSKYSREMSIMTRGSFCSKNEIMRMKIVVPTHKASMLLQLCDDQKIKHVKGIIEFGAYKFDINEVKQPTLLQPNIALWRVDKPLIGETYTLVWTIESNN